MDKSERIEIINRNIELIKEYLNSINFYVELSLENVKQAEILTNKQLLDYAFYHFRLISEYIKITIDKSSIISSFCTDLSSYCLEKR